MPTTSPGSTSAAPVDRVNRGHLFSNHSITFKGTPSSISTATIIVGYTLDFRGDTSIKNYTYLPTGGGPITSATLAE